MAVDLVVLGVLADGGRRRSEAAALTWSDVEFWPDGTARLTVQKGKNQPDPATVALTKTTARALRGIQPDAGLRPDRRDAGQPDSWRCSSRRPGRRLLRTQRPDRHGAADGGRRGTDRGGPAPRAMEARGHGGPVYPGRGRRRGAEVVDLVRIGRRPAVTIRASGQMSVNPD